MFIMHRIRVNVHKNYLDHLFWAFYYLGTQYTKLSIFPHKETFFFLCHLFKGISEIGVNCNIV